MLSICNVVIDLFYYILIVNVLSPYVCVGGGGNNQLINMSYEINT